MSFTAVGVLTFLLDITSCSDNPCQNGGECEDVQDDYVCYCLLGYIGDNCQFQGGVVNTTVCLTSSQSLDNDSSCAKAVDGSDANGLGTEWVIAGTNGAIGAYIVLHLVDKYNVIGIKYLQRCEPQMQFKKLIITLNDGTVKMMNTTCSGSTSDDCDNDRWETLMYDSAKSNIYLIKITILEVCSGQIQTNVGLRDVEILTTVGE
ncbi:hypothetical protein LSH36_730g01041 [Paralvinella palmiformis]|uniref:EGF-like domain-containing protein n=1 Tax=Paralvinella palmiformis TaxID=53620 RepID=A0AAD9J193_9ANNE|nr:hypothetical protein LSH36_730g01041 [Paralvinella palmiformis]